MSALSKPPKPHELSDAKIAITLLVLFVLSVITGLISYYGAVLKIDPVLIGLSSPIFGASSAGLLGGIVFELYLRRDLMREMNSALLDIMTTDKSVLRTLSQEKRNNIIETLISLSTDKEEYGSGLFLDFVARFTDKSFGQHMEFRYNFKEELTLAELGSAESELERTFFRVNDKISYESEPKLSDKFVVGCACNLQQLYELFSDPACIYRWLLPCDAKGFEALMAQESTDAFSCNLEVAGIPCKRLNGRGELTSRGFEMIFENPLVARDLSGNVLRRGSYGVEYRIRTSALQARAEKYLSIHLVYPVKGAEVTFDYDLARIPDPICVYFVTKAKNKPLIEEDQKRNRFVVTVSNDHWLFPDSGIIFLW